MVQTVRFLILTVFGFLSASVLAHPVIFKGGTATMIDLMEGDQSAYVYHSWTRTDAVGARVWRLDGQRDVKNQTFLLAQYNRLFKRWFGDDYQANLYLGAGLGAAREDNADPDPAAGWLVQADYETLHWYLAAQSLSGFTSDVMHVKNSITLGYTPYKADYDEMSVWGMIRAQHISEFSDEIVLMPLVRIFTRSVFTEFGITLEGHPRIHVMYHF